MAFVFVILVVGWSPEQVVVVSDFANQVGFSHCISVHCLPEEARSSKPHARMFMFYDVDGVLHFVRILVSGDVISHVTCPKRK